MITPKKLKFSYAILLILIFSAFSFIDDATTKEPILAFWNFIVQVIIMLAISVAIRALSPKPKRPSPNHAKPVGLEQFDFPTVMEGRPMQVIFGKKYIAGPNVVWYGHLKTVAVWGF